MQFKERPIVIKGCFAFGAERKAFNLLMAKRLTPVAQFSTGDLKSKASISNGCTSRCPLYFVSAAIRFRWRSMCYY